MLRPWIAPVCMLLLTVGCYDGIPDDAWVSDGSTGDSASASGNEDPSAATSEPSGDGDPASSAGDGDGDSTPSGDGDSTTSGDGDGDSTTSGDGDGDPPGDGDGDPPGDGDGDGTTTTGDGDGDPNQSVCERWNADRMDIAEGSWTGAINGCSAGDMAGDWRQRTLKTVNLYRWLVGLPAVTTDPSKDQLAQECALMMHANNQLSHNPPMNWSCYSADGASGAGSSNIAGAPGIQAVDLYIADPGNATTLGHRRWILSKWFGPTGIGSTSQYNCLWAFGNSDAGGPWLAYPPPGEFPIQAATASWQSIDQTGWSVQSYAPFSLQGASVTITVEGNDMPVTVTQLQPNFGSDYAISIIPQGWTTQAGTTYHVEISGASEPIAYDVEIVDCG